MRKTVFVLLAMVLVPFCAFGVDGMVLINQSTVMAAGGFPYKITQPGSYRLSGNLTVPDANTTAILVFADNVTIDLNGFSIIGPVVCTGSPVTFCSPAPDPSNNLVNGYGVNGGNNITVFNGTVRGMGRYGINLGGIGGSVEKVHALSNGGAGINCFDCTVSGNTANRNGFNGIVVSRGTVSGNTANENLAVGIAITKGTVSGNTANLNGAGGIVADCPSSVVGNTASSNVGPNLTTFLAGCAIANNAAP